MEPTQQDLLETAPLQEMEEETVTEVDLSNPFTEEERDEMQSELAKLEEEICTLKQVLGSKEKRHAELKQQLGITPLSELKQNFTKSWSDMQTSIAYKKTSETLSTAGQKTSAAFNNLGSAISRRFGDMRSNSIGYSVRHSVSMPAMRNSPSFRSLEERMESTVSNIKSKVGPPRAGGSFEEVLSSTANASAQDPPTNNLPEDDERSC